MRLETERLHLSVLRPGHADQVASYLSRNREFHKPFHQSHDDLYFTLQEQKEYLRSDLRRYYEGSMVPFWVSLKESPDQVIGRLSFSYIIRGAMKTCLVGYHLDREKTGCGYMREALRGGCDYMFRVHGLHRIQADVMPENEASRKVVEAVGFEEMGYNRLYMEIDGTYRDHVLYVLLSNRGCSVTRLEAED